MIGEGRVKRSPFYRDKRAPNRLEAYRTPSLAFFLSFEGVVLAEIDRFRLLRNALFLLRDHVFGSSHVPFEDKTAKADLR